VSSDLIRARTERVDASVSDYLNDLVARAYAQIHAGAGSRGRRLGLFFIEEFPRLFRAEWKAIALSALLLFFGGGVGAVAVALDTDALGVLLPEQHQEMTPDERVDQDAQRGAHAGDQAAQFSSFLFTHNIQVSFLVFALGITFGVGTASMLFYNGVPLGALAMQYHQAGEDLFFWAWILPHGIPELTSIFIAGGAGLLLARGLLLPGRRRRRDALVAEAKRAARLVVGTMPSTSRWCPTGPSWSSPCSSGRGFSRGSCSPGVVGPRPRRRPPGDSEAVAKSTRRDRSEARRREAPSQADRVTDRRRGGCDPDPTRLHQVS